VRELSTKPGSEQRLYLPAAAGPLETRSFQVICDDDERREHAHIEAPHDVRLQLLVDDVEAERPVIAAALQHLREEAFDAPTVSGDGGGEEQQPRLFKPRCGDRYLDGRHSPWPAHFSEL